MEVVKKPDTPPEDCPWTIDELVRSRSLTDPTIPLVAYPSAAGEYVDYTARQLEHYAYRFACHYATLIEPRSSSNESTKVVALLAQSNLDYLLTAIALSKLGMTVLFLSTRLSDVAYISLLNVTNCRHVLVDEGLQPKTTGIIREIPDLSVNLIAHLEEYDCHDIDENIDTSMDKQFDKSVESGNVAWIIHSSGSTGLPKPIYQTHAAALRNYANNFNMRGFITLPLYHAHGLGCVFRSIHAKKQIHVYPSSLPLAAPTLLETMRKYDFEIFYGVPYALKLLSETEDGIMHLRKMKLVMFGGSSCPDELGDKLVKNGVMLISHYGTTETGQLMTSFREKGDLDWNYLRVPKSLQPFVRWEERGAGILELVVLEGWPSKVATNRDDGAYATKDLFKAHPTKENCYKWIGRQDDTIVLLNGEKALPIRIEHTVRQNPLVAEAVIFGAGKPHLGMFVIPAPGTEGISDDELRSRVMPTVDIANSEQPGFSHISPEMIHILPRGTLYPKTDKDTVIRAAFYQQFKGEIDRIYEEFSEKATGTENFTQEELVAFLRRTISSVMGLDETTLGDESDFFSLGMDSLQALRVHSAIVKTLNTNGARVGQNVVFEYPSLTALTKYLHSLSQGNSVTSEPVTETMSRLLEKYSHFRPHTPGSLSGRGRGVLVTGATGSLGAHVVAQLVQRSDIDKVYCLVRSKSRENAEVRVLESLHLRKLAQYVRSQEQKKIVALPSDLGEQRFGVEEEVFEKMLEDVGVVIHLAWAVNFNMGVGSFEKHHIAGTHALIQFCLDSKREKPAAFYFGSSVSAVVNGARVADEKIETDFTRAQGMGYAQSKLVTENICYRAAQQTGINCKVLRIGQIVGDTSTGTWNSTEAIPLMIQSATTIGALPALDEAPTWLPVDTVARATLEICDSTVDNNNNGSGAVPEEEVFHLVNPCTFHWTRDLLPALKAAGLEFETVSQQEWIVRLRASNPDPVQNPPYKLLEFFANKYEDVSKMRSTPYFKTDLACSYSPSLHGAARLNLTLVEKFVKNWQTECWSNNNNNDKDSPSTSTILIITGPCGSGKSTVSSAISRAYNIPYLDADTCHSASSIAKMQSGTPLTDSDRWSWLERVKRQSIGAATGSSERGGGVVVACSALRRAYRDRLREVPGDDLRVRFLMLEAGDAEVLDGRISERREHYMPVGMARGQVCIAEGPEGDERDVVVVDGMMEKERMVERGVGIAGIWMKG